MAVSLNLDHKDYQVGDTIRAAVVVTNDGDKPVVLPLPDFCLHGASFRLVRPGGSQSWLTRVGPQPATRSVPQGQSLSGTIELIAVEAGQLQLQAVYNPRRPAPDFRDDQAEISAPVALSVRAGRRLRVRLDTEAGPIEMEFFPEAAHNHVLSFVQLAARGYFNGISFHRIVPGFVIQGGDPTGGGSGGPGYKLPAEFSPRLHDDGVLSMARTSDPHSAGSQFFICLGRERTAALDNQYTVFGRVVSGLEAVHTIGAGESNAGKYHMRRAEVIVA